MGILDRLKNLDAAVGAGPRAGEYRHEYLARMARSRWRTGYVPRALYAEVTDLHDRVAALEARVAALEARDV